MKPFDFYLITDTHYFKSSLGASGKEYDEFMRFEQKCFAETSSINKAIFEYLKTANEADTLLIAGDLSFNGEMESHLEFIEMLRDLKKSGKRVFVITADHDCKEHPFAFGENGRYEPEGTPREKLFDLYYEFGFEDAIAVDRQHLSYVVQLADGIRLLALNNDGADDGRRRFDEEHVKWIKEQTAKAREDGQMMIAMNHYPLLPGKPIFSIINTAMQTDCASVSTMLADEGVHLVLTGHMHNQSINMITTEAGNRFYDVCTGSTIADPSVIRHIHIENRSTVEVKTIPAPDFEWETGGRSCKQYLADLFDNMILNMLSDMRDNPQNVLRKVHAGDGKKAQALVRLAGKILNRIKVGTLCRLMWIKCDRDLKKMPLKRFAADLVREAFEGNPSFTEGTPKGDVFVTFLKRINPLLRKIKAKTYDGKRADIYELLRQSAGSYGIDDYNATLNLE